MHKKDECSYLVNMNGDIVTYPYALPSERDVFTEILILTYWLKDASHQPLATRFASYALVFTTLRCSLGPSGFLCIVILPTL